MEKNLNLIDYYILYQLQKLLEESNKNYQKYNFTTIYFSLLNFCINDLSSFYFEISKDSLYCDSISSVRRKQIITTLYYLLEGLTKIILPILPYLAEEVYRNIPLQFDLNKRESVYLANFSLNWIFPINIENKLEIISEFFLPLRQDVFQFLEKARQEKIITSNSQAKLSIYLKKKTQIDYSELNLAELLMVAEVEIKEEISDNMREGKFCFVKVSKINHEQCLRCRAWRKLENDVCHRCQKVLTI